MNELSPAGSSAKRLSKEAGEAAAAAGGGVPVDGAPPLAAASPAPAPALAAAPALTAPALADSAAAALSPFGVSSPLHPLRANAAAAVAERRVSEGIEGERIAGRIAV